MIFRPLTIGLAVLLMATAGCSGGGSSSDDSSSPTVAPVPATTSTSASPRATFTMPAPPPFCPVTEEMCTVANGLMFGLQRRDTDAVADQMKPQRLPCPVTTSQSAEEAALAALCVGRPVGSAIEVYEVHTGNGPLYLPTREEYKAEIAKDFAAWPSDGAVSIKAVGCGVQLDNAPITPDCSTASVVVYSIEGVATDLALVLSRPVLSRPFSREESGWAVEKYWRVFPGALPPVVPDGLRLAINTVAGVTAVELHPYPH
jgi:hypothetical protein